MRLWLGVLFLSVSCDKVLGLTEHIDAPPEKDADLRPDAVDCVLYPGGQPDEDADGRNDFCDNCPTVSNVTQIDGDGDDVGYDCDPAPLNAGDHIAFFGSMLTAQGLELDATVTLANSAATIKTGKVKVAARVKPTFVVAELSIRSFNTGDKLTVEVAEGGQEWSCNLGFGLGECAGNNCQYTKAPSPQAIQPINFDEVAMTTRVVMETRGNGFTQCATTVPGMPETRSFATSSPVVEAQGSVAVKMQGDLELRNVIVYDRP